MSGGWVAGSKLQLDVCHCNQWWRRLANAYEVKAGMPQYLSELIQPLSDVDSRRRLRSASTGEVLGPATRRSTIGDRALAVAGPRAWNSLPVDMRLSGTFSTFKTHLKSHLFNISFPSV